jgi:hypothetical protein
VSLAAGVLGVQKVTDSGDVAIQKQHFAIVNHVHQ